MEMRCEVRFRDMPEGFTASGIDEINAAIQSGRRVTKIDMAIICDKITDPAAVAEGMVRLAYTGAMTKVTLED